MRVAFLNARFRRGFHDGSNTHIRQFVTNAIALGHEIWMDARGAHPDAKTLPATRALRAWKLRAMDAIYVRIEHIAPKVAGWATPSRRWLVGNPLFVLEFNTVAEYGKYVGFTDGQIQNQLERFRALGRHIDLAVCVSEKLERYVRDRFGIRRTLTVPNGSDPELFRPGLPLPPRLNGFANAFNVLWLGSAFIPWHNFEMLNAAAKLLNDRGNRRIQFHLLGEGVASLALRLPNVHAHGPQPPEQLAGWMSAMDVGLCLYQPGPADFGSPLKLFDYLMSGLCVVATEHPQCRELFGALGQTDLLVPPDDSAWLAETLERLDASPDYVREQRRKGHELALARHTWRHSVASTFTEIEALRRR